MSRRREFVEHVLELAAGLGAVSARPMFGGRGVYLDGVMFALIADDALYFKTDARSRGEFSDRGLEPFSYLRRGKPHLMSYHRAPEEALDDPEEMQHWARGAWEAARRSR